MQGVVCGTGREQGVDGSRVLVGGCRALVGRRARPPAAKHDPSLDTRGCDTVCKAFL